MILIIYAHPYPQHSHANKRMLEQARTLEGVEIRSLYQLYPDFNIDIEVGVELVERAYLHALQRPCLFKHPLIRMRMLRIGMRINDENHD